MIPLPIRRALFFLFVGIFLISAPLVVLYTAGYRFNRTSNTVLQTGTLSLASIPRGADIFLHGQDVRDTTPTVLQRLPQGTHAVRIERNGYYPWERSVHVQSGATTYITAPLFSRSEETPLKESTSAWTRSENERTIAALDFPEGIRLAPTSAGVEVFTDSLTGSTLLTLLPSGTYTPLVVSDRDLFVKNERNEIFYLSLERAQAAYSLGRNITASAWEPDERFFAWTDGIEVRIFFTASQTQDFITRQSDILTALHFAHNGGSLLLASAGALIGIDLASYNNGRLHTTLATFSEPTSVWFSRNGDTAFFERGTSRSSLLLTP